METIPDRARNFFAARRIQLKLRQKDIAVAAGYTSASVSIWERGRFAPRLEEAVNLAKAYRVTTSRMLREIGELADRVARRKARSPILNRCRCGKRIRTLAATECVFCANRRKARRTWSDPSKREKTLAAMIAGRKEWIKRRDVSRASLYPNSLPAAKTCTRCGQAKPIVEFYLRKSTGKLHEYACRSCLAAASRARCKGDPPIQFNRRRLKFATPLRPEEICEELRASIDFDSQRIDRIDATRRAMTVVHRCVQCSRKFRLTVQRIRSRLRQGKYSGCCNRCKDYLPRNVPSGPLAHNWKGGRTITKCGYVLVYAPNHPHAVKKKVLEHRLVMEKHLGRFLLRRETVHHKNGNRRDNRLENLELWTKNHGSGIRYDDIPTEQLEQLMSTLQAIVRARVASN